MGQSSSFAFLQGSARGRQKQRKNLRRYLRNLPAHKRLTKWDKLFRKRAFQRRTED